MASKKRKQSGKSHVGPGKELVTLYADKELHEAVKKRAKTFGMSASKYLYGLAKRDISEGGDLRLTPNKSD